MSLISNYKYIRDWCNHKFLTKDDQVDLSNYYTKNEVDTIGVWASGTGESSAQLRNSGSNATGEVSVAEGVDTTASGNYSHAEGFNTTASGPMSHAEGDTTTADGNSSHAEGTYTTASGYSSHAEGFQTFAQNRSEHAQGQYNNSTTNSNTFGNAGNTSFSHGIGTSSSNRKNAVEIMENGDMYVYGVGSYDGTNFSSATTLQNTINNAGAQYVTKTDYQTDKEVTATSLNNLNTKINTAVGSLALSLDPSDYKLTLSGTKVDGTTFTVSDVVDLPLESVVVNGSYDDATKKVVLTLQNGSTVEFSVADLISGLQSEITSTNKLSADLLKDGTTNKVVTAAEKNTWNGKQNAITTSNKLDYSLIANTPTIPAAVTESTVSGWGFTKNSGTYSKPSGGIPKTDLASAVQTSLGKADTALQSYTETDPVFSASAAAGITSSDITNWNSKTSNTGTVTQVKVGNTAYNPSSGVVTIPAYPTTLPASDVSAWAKATSKPTYTAAEVGALPSTTTIPAAPGTLKTNATTAQTASSGEAMSGTITLHKIAKTGTYSDLIGTPTIPTKVSDLTNDSGFTKNTGTITGIKMNGSSKGTSGVVDLGTVLTAHQDISGKQDVISDLATIRSNASAGAAKVSNVQADWNATSGLAQILNKPTIPAAVTQSTVSGWGFTKNAGTITGIKMNGTSKGTSGVVDLGTVLTAHQDISGKQDTITDLATIRSNASAGAAKVSNVQSDWNATSGLAQILNKPDLTNYVTKTDYQIDEEVIAASLNDLNARIDTLEHLIQEITQ